MLRRRVGGIISFGLVVLLEAGSSQPALQQQQSHQINDRYGDSSSTSTATQETLEPWQQCSIFIAPSLTGGYGVFAARDFVKDEIVEVAPFFLPMDYNTPFIINSVLFDYVYGYERQRRDGLMDPQQLFAVVWGPTIFFNHNDQNHNVEWKTFGFEPLDFQDSVDININDKNNRDMQHIRSVGYTALRDISAGEELFTNYGLHDGGEQWFAQRGIVKTSPEASQMQLSVDQLEKYQQQFCSKIYAGMDYWTYTQRLAPDISSPWFLNVDRLLPTLEREDPGRRGSVYDDPLYPFAITKFQIIAGQRIELAPALVLDRNLIRNTAMAPLVYYWEDLTEDLQVVVRDLRDKGYYVVQYQGNDTSWQREDRFTTFEESVILPVGGLIGRVQRVGNDTSNANCQVNILAVDASTSVEDVNDSLAAACVEQTQQQSPFASGNTGIVLELVAIRDISVGERIRVNLPPAGNFNELLALYNEKKRSGQMYTVWDRDAFQIN